jgi:Spy/CpxP family protein refolding chaperone
MLAQIRKQERKVATVLVLVAAGLLVSCASQSENVALVKDPDAKPEGAMPWNKQEKWEGSGSQLANLTDHR